MAIPSPDGERVAIAYTADGFVQILNATTKQITDCLSVRHIPNSKVHTGAWYVRNHRSFFVMVDMTGRIRQRPGGGLHLWDVSTTGKPALLHSWSAAASLNSTLVKPIAMGANALHPTLSGRFFVTDAKQGGGYFVDVGDDRIDLVAHVPPSVLSPCTSGGGLWVYAHPSNPDRVFAQYGTQTYNRSCLYELEVGQARHRRTFLLSENGIDAHGMAFCYTDGAMYMLSTNRVSSTMDIIEYESGALVKKDIDLNALFEGDFATVEGRCRRETTPPAEKRFQPDVLAHKNGRIFQVARGRRPFSAVRPENWLPYAAPGLYSYHVDEDCLGVHRDSDVSLSADNHRNTLHAADPHGGDMVGDEMWMIDQSPTGLTIYCEDYGYERTLSYLKGGRLREPIACPPETFAASPPPLPPFVAGM